jgi:hypothetical protein
MLRTHEGIPEGDRIRWAGEDVPATDRPLRVPITVLEEEAKKEKQGQKRANALSKRAAPGALLFHLLRTGSRRARRAEE